MVGHSGLGVSFDIAKEALRLAAQKLPVKTKFIIARDYENWIVMKQNEIKKLSKEDLKEKLKEFEISLKDLKIKHSISPIENPLEIKKIRRIIARLKTFESNQ